MARRPGEIYLAVLEAVKVIKRATWRRLYEYVTSMGLQATPNAVRRTVVNMVRLSRLAAVGFERVPGVCRPLRVYGLPVESGHCVPLSHALQLWR